MEKINEVKHYVESVGIDVSKLTLDVFLYNKKVHYQFSNDRIGFISMQKWRQKENGGNYCDKKNGSW